MSHLDHLRLHAILRSNFKFFFRRVFQTVYPGVDFINNWHLDAIAYELMRVHQGENRFLLITQPPRSMKTLATSVAYPAFALGHEPHLQFIVASYGQDLANKFASQFRTVVQSPWYQELFPNVVAKRDVEDEFVTTQNGGRFATSVGSGLTGRGADVIIIDDPLKADDAQSQVARRRAIDWLSNTVFTRLNNKVTGRMIVVMQRLHEFDPAGYLIEEGGWHHLNLPAVALEDETIPIGNGRVHRRRKGDVLQPKYEPQEALDDMRRKLGSLAYSAQYLQQPVPADGNLIERDWFNSYDPKTLDLTTGLFVQSWDIAVSVDDARDYSVCTTWRVFGGDFCLVHVWRGRMKAPALKKQIVRLAKEFKADTVLIEKDGLGAPILQQLQHEEPAGMPYPTGIKALGDKTVRLQSASTRIEAGQVYLPKDAPWLADFMNEVLAFPNGRYDDQVDSMAQFLNWSTKQDFYPPSDNNYPLVVWVRP